jgi:tripartite-type tricarboxylate transporter receptor subunit TctC
MMGKRIALALDSYSGIAGAIQAGNAIPLAVAGPKRMVLLPNLPTVAETLPGYEAEGWQTLVAPIGTPDEIVQKISAALTRAMTDPDVGQRLDRIGRDHPPMSPAETLAFIQHEQAKWAPILAHIDITR